jgi:hypothetical protein
VVALALRPASKALTGTAGISQDYVASGRREQAHCHSYRECDAFELGCGAFVRAVAHDGN